MSKKGFPKYQLGDTVSFILSGLKMTGTIEIIDAYGTFEFPDDVCYDILACSDKYKSAMNPLGECLYKHVKEDELIEN